MILKILFWIFIGLVLYTYLGYFLIITIIRSIKILVQSKDLKSESERPEPEITLLIAAYNEKDFVDQKIKNTLELDYPEEKIKQIWITDGSDDGTPELVKSHKGVTVHHRTERKGKVAAMNRGMQFVDTPLVIFSDGNTLLAKDTIRKIVTLFKDPSVGCVAGEKRILMQQKDAAVSSGEGLYWKYESLIKKCESDIHSVVGAAGELFAIRTDLFEEVKEDTLLDDFVISLTLAYKGYKIKYDPEANAIEYASSSVKEEFKRKVRIASGGIQTMLRMPELFNIFKLGFFTVQYISHKVLRWTIVPFSFPLLLIFNILIISQAPIILNIYSLILILQLIFYLIAILGWVFEHKTIRLKIFFSPYYLLFMNFSMILGYVKYFSGKQSVQWERAKRGN